jgi:hypothetical protein
VQEGAAEIRFTAQRPGRSSVGVRFNKVDYFKACDSRSALHAPGRRLEGSSSAMVVAATTRDANGLTPIAGHGGSETAIHSHYEWIQSDHCILLLAERTRTLRWHGARPLRPA